MNARWAGFGSVLAHRGAGPKVLNKLWTTNCEQPLKSLLSPCASAPPPVTLVCGLVLAQRARTINLWNRRVYISGAQETSFQGSPRHISVTFPDFCSQTGPAEGRHPRREGAVVLTRRYPHMPPNSITESQGTGNTCLLRKKFFAQIRLRISSSGVPLGKLKALRNSAVIFLTQASWFDEEICFSLEHQLTSFWQTNIPLNVM